MKGFAQGAEKIVECLRLAEGSVGFVAFDNPLRDGQPSGLRRLVLVKSPVGLATKRKHIVREFRKGQTGVFGKGFAVCAPPVARPSREISRLVVLKLAPERVARLEGEPLERAVAETVDRRYRGLVEFEKRDFNAGARQSVRFCLAARKVGPRAVAQLLQACNFAVVAFVLLVPDFILPPLKKQRQVGEDLADAVAQFLRGGLGEGHHLDFPDAKPLLHHKTGTDILDVVCLARSGRRLHQVGAVKREHGIVHFCVERVSHGDASAFLNHCPLSCGFCSL